ncbi:MAG: hypothetical protein IJ644_06285 [Oscillospiraceae bacterium]|nr:hypothetical protein [Oscillospiraceae bacterium]
MPKYFNVTGSCSPEKHYMVSLDSRLGRNQKYVDAGKYFSVNRGRQYGKTTMLKTLARYLNQDYLVISLDFQRQMSNVIFRS